MYDEQSFLGRREEVCMAEILVSTGALIGRPNGRDYRLLLPFSEQLHCDGYEFMMYSDWYQKIDDIVAFLKENKIHTPVYHCQKSIGESISKGGEAEFADAFSRFEQNAKMAAAMGARKMVIHLWDGITSDQHFENNIEAYATVKRIADEYGVDLLVENVVCNVQSPTERWCQLREKYPEIHLIFDTKMAAFHEQLDYLYSEEYAWLWREGHIKHYHVNDYAGGFMDWANLRTLPIGNGHVDFERFFTFMNKIGYDDTYTLESTAFNREGYVDIDMLNRQIEYIRGHIK